MQGEANDRVRKIRSRVLAERALISDLDGQLTDNYLKQLLQRASYTLDDVENVFLGSALQEPRTPAAESTWLGYTEFVLEMIAVPQRKVVQDIVAKFGPNAQSF